MTTLKKVLAMALASAVLIGVTIVGTIAYLTDREEVVNTFTVGNVAIKLDEEAVTPDGKPTPEDDARVQGNEYRLLPGQTYTKDPKVTVEAGSEEAYVRMLVTVSHISQLTEIFDNNLTLRPYIGGWDVDKWIYERATDANNERTYELRYYKTVDPDDTLEPLFTTFTVPDFVNGTDLATLAPTSASSDDGFKITVVAHAIQAEGFADANAAWAAFDEQWEAEHPATP